MQTDRQHEANFVLEKNEIYVFEEKSCSAEI